jgi:AcrR family transcriptional regulator
LILVIISDTNICMNPPTRERLLTAASRLFAEHGFRGASVRDICNHAGANPGAVSYHFGGKRQLYRAVLRRATARLADLTPRAREGAEDATPPTMLEVLDMLVARMESDTAASPRRCSCWARPGR